MSEHDEILAALIEANRTLTSQIAECETTEINLRKANADLGAQLKTQLEEVARLKRLLQEQIEEHKRIQARELEQRILKEALQETVAAMSNTLDLDKVLDHILDTVKRVTPYDGANVLFIESDLVHVVRQRGYHEKGVEEDWLKQPIPLARLAALQHMMDIGQPLATPNTSNSSIGFSFPGSNWINSNVIAPIRLKDKTLGFLSLDSATPGFFTQIHAEQLQVFADQAAIAIQNARLYDRAKRAAVLEERSRLANELHDTISQTLWSVSLIAERLPVLWEVNREEGKRSLASLHELAQGALAEMRSLLLELRPSVLMDAKLGDLIHQLAHIFATRTGLIFSVTLHNQDPLPPHVQVVLYRVVQECINNITRHASASHVEINFNSHAGQVELTIQDNGRGFDPTNITPGHLGLSIMRDRVQSIGATLETTSAKMEGTHIRVVWTASLEEKMLAQNGSGEINGY
ncbi:MAG: GAF domain-containing sensor histidine kinase [Anaerolineae bacterium]|nr:GAF domain-containing sensor histidine kinase [Anaerolineae bacterium]